MVWLQLGVVLIVVVFFLYIAASFGAILVELLINGVIIFLILYRSYYEIRAGRMKNHIIGAVVAFVLILFFANFGKPFWLITTFLVLEFAVAQVLQFVRPKEAKKAKKSIPRGKLIKKG